MGIRDDGQGSNGTVPQDSVLSTFATQSTRNKFGKSLRKCQSTKELASSKATCLPMPSEREASLVREFSDMSLDGKRKQERENQASSTLRIDTASSSLPQPITTPRKSESRTQGVLGYNKEKTEYSQVVPKTPSGKDMVENIKRTFQECTPNIRAPSASPTKKLFLTKHSNLKDFAVNDIDEKVSQMNDELEKLKHFMVSTERSNAGVKDELEVSKKRSEHYLQRPLQKSY